MKYEFFKVARLFGVPVSMCEELIYMGFIWDRTDTVGSEVYV